MGLFDKSSFTANNRTQTNTHTPNQCLSHSPAIFNRRSRPARRRRRRWRSSGKPFSGHTPLLHPCSPSIYTPHPLLRFRNRPPPPLTGGGAAVRRDERERPRERDREERERTDDGGGDRWFLSRTSSRRLGPADGVKVRRAMSLSDELFRFHGSDGSRLHPTNFDECAFFLFLFRVNTVMLHSG
ncbi:uncharacterized protein LOC110900934 [Helianthus annuus]|uniref:uncharacterized protein LOC110900934 n=1 Tax=Helianthus annuus TaxID=4232 RepID=UPI000B9008C1|nr:uncharacterized protein LOC110900934 [Helianthus annuus]